MKKLSLDTPAIFGIAIMIIVCILWEHYFGTRLNGRLFGENSLTYARYWDIVFLPLSFMILAFVANFKLIYEPDDGYQMRTLKGVLNNWVIHPSRCLAGLGAVAGFIYGFFFGFLNALIIMVAGYMLISTVILTITLLAIAIILFVIALAFTGILTTVLFLIALAFAGISIVLAIALVTYPFWEKYLNNLAKAKKTEQA